MQYLSINIKNMKNNINNIIFSKYDTNIKIYLLKMKHKN